MRFKHSILVALAVAGALAITGSLALRHPTQARGRSALLHAAEQDPEADRLADARQRAGTGAGPSRALSTATRAAAPTARPTARRPPTARPGAAVPGTPTSRPPAGQCSARLGDNVKVNQNCLNIADADLQGRSQANNETSIAQNPSQPDAPGRQRQQLHPRRRDLRRRTTRSTAVATGRTRRCPTASPAARRGFPREYWQAGGDTSVAWDTRGNAYMSCQLFNRGTATSPNPDQSSAFVLYRSTGNNGASWNFPGRYATVVLRPDRRHPGRARGQGS